MSNALLLQLLEAFDEEIDLCDSPPVPLRIVLFSLSVLGIVVNISH